MVPATTAIVLGLMLAACASRGGSSASDEGATESGEEGTTADTTEETGTASTETGESSTTESDATDTDDGCAGFYAGCPDAPSYWPCDIWEQDCPDGQKCTAFATSGASWDAHKCVPVVGDGAPGDDCTATDGSPVSGNDDCAHGSMCWSIDADTGIGYCVAFCSGSPGDPECGMGTACEVDDVLPLCLSQCDPLGDGAECPDAAKLCIPDPGGQGFFCVPPGESSGGYGEPCQFVNDCAQGLFCAGADFVPGCEAEGCCSEFCDLGQPNTCMGAGDGQICVPWWEGMAPPGHEDVGACAIP